MPSANEIAQYFTAHAASRGDSLDERTLQALLYTAQGFSLLMFKQPLFDDPINVSDAGPVIALSDIGGEGAQEPDDSETREFLSGIYERHGPGHRARRRTVRLGSARRECPAERRTDRS